MTIAEVGGSAEVGGTQQRRATNAGGSARRTQLLAIAERMFATHGYAQTTVRDIADEAGILSGSLYHHFASKEAMLTELLHEFMDGLTTRAEAIVADGDTPREILNGLVRNAFQTIHDMPHAVALFQNEAALLTTNADFRFVAQASERIEQIWLEVLDAGRAAGEFRDDVEPTLAYRFIRDAVWSSVQWYRPGGRFDHTVVAEQWLAMLHGGLLTR